MSRSKSIVMIIAYFGKWPDWIHFFMASCAANPTIDWLIYTDCDAPENTPTNVRIRTLEFGDYQRLIRERLTPGFQAASPYKMCDVKPFLGFLHRDEIEGYDWFGFGDLDVVYGNLRRFITDDVLERHEVFSSHAGRLSGHFALFENSLKHREMFRKIRGWEAALSDPKTIGLDEAQLGQLYRRFNWAPRKIRKRLWSHFGRFSATVFYEEQHSTIFSNIPWLDGTTGMDQPDVWFWCDGELKNSRDGDRQFMYLHFMNWKSPKHLPKALRDQPAAWQNLDALVHVDHRDPAGWKITSGGFLPVEREASPSSEIPILSDAGSALVAE
jgi:hypothetical protein